MRPFLSWPFFKHNNALLLAVFTLLCPGNPELVLLTEQWHHTNWLTSLPTSSMLLHSLGTPDLLSTSVTSFSLGPIPRGWGQDQVFPYPENCKCRLMWICRTCKTAFLRGSDNAGHRETHSQESQRILKGLSYYSGLLFLMEFMREKAVYWGAWFTPFSILINRLNHTFIFFLLHSPFP